MNSIWILLLTVGAILGLSTLAPDKQVQELRKYNVQFVLSYEQITQPQINEVREVLREWFEHGTITMKVDSTTR